MNNEEKILQMLEQMQGDIASIKQKQEAHNKSILHLENNVMHELKLLNENLPNALARSEKLEDVAATVDDHDHRIFALEQATSNK